MFFNRNFSQTSRKYSIVLLGLFFSNLLVFILLYRKHMCNRNSNKVTLSCQSSDLWYEPSISGGKPLKFIIRYFGQNVPIFFRKKKQKKESKNLTFRFYEVNSSNTGEAIVLFISNTNANTEIVLFWFFFRLLGAFFIFMHFIAATQWPNIVP